MEKNRLPYRYVITYETTTVEGELIVKQVDFRTSGMIKARHQFEMAEVLISTKREEGRGAKIIGMRPMFKTRAESKDEGVGEG